MEVAVMKMDYALAGGDVGLCKLKVFSRPVRP